MAGDTNAFSDDASCEIGSLVFKRTKEVNVRRAVEAVSGYITSIAAQGETSTLSWVWAMMAQ